MAVIITHGVIATSMVMADTTVDFMVDLVMDIHTATDMVIILIMIMDTVMDILITDMDTDMVTLTTVMDGQEKPDLHIAKVKDAK